MRAALGTDAPLPEKGSDPAALLEESTRLIFDHSLAAAVISGTLVALPTMIAMIRYQDAAWDRAAAEPLRPGVD